MPAKILFTSHTADFAKFNQPLIKLLHDKHCIVHYASAGEKPIPNTDKNFRVDFARSPFKFSQHVRAYRQIKKITNKGNYDLIHTHTPVGSVLTRLAARQARKRGTRILYTAHGFHFYTGAPLSAWLTWYPIEKYCSHLTDAVVTINHEDYNLAKKRFWGQTYLMPGVGVDLVKFRSKVSTVKKAALRSELALEPDDFVIINVAEINKNKNQKLIINALPQILSVKPNVQVLFVGDDKLNGKLQQLAKKLGVESYVRFLGYRHDLPQLFSISNLLVAASQREGLGLNLLEAMAANLPVLASDNRGHREVLSSKYLFRNDDIQDLVKKLNQVCTQPAPTFPHKFSLENSLTVIDKVYRNVLGEKYAK